MTDADLDDVAASLADTVLGALQRVLEGSAFASAEQARRFLAYVVHETISGRGAQLNERSIARLAFDRSVGVDDGGVPSVRMLAGRVRERLERHYRGEGRNDPFRLSIPLGQYAVICSRHRPSEPDTTSRVTDAPMIAVMRFASGGRGSASHRFAAGVSESLVHALTRFPGVRVAGPLAPGPMATREDAIDIGGRTGARFVLFGRLREVDNVIRVNVQLADSSQGEVVWSDQLDVDSSEFPAFGAEDEVVARVAAQIADHRGVALTAPPALGHFTDGPGGRRAIMGYYEYIDSLDPAAAPAVIAQLQQALADDSTNAFVAGLLASAASIEVLLRGAEAAPQAFARAEQVGREALRLDSRSPYAHAALATVALGRGERAECRAHVRALLDAAPHHPSLLYRAGLLTAGCGDWDDGVAIIRRATRLNPHHPSHFRTMLVLDHLRCDDIAAALAEAQMIRLEGYVWAPLCLAICLKELGMDQLARDEVQALERVAPDFFDRPRDIVSAAPAIPPDVVELLMRHIGDLRALTRAG